MRNPFNPTFGTVPITLVGREDEISYIVERVSTETASLYSAIICEGIRGVGKTAMLYELSGRLEAEHGWIAINVNTSSAMLDDIMDQLFVKTKRLIDTGRTRISSFNFLQFGVGFENYEYEIKGFRTKFEIILEELNEKGISVYITVDEIHKEVSELRTFCETVQMCFGRSYGIAVAFAGLPEAVAELLKYAKETRRITFLRRAKRVKLTNVPVESTAAFYEDIFRSNGVNVDVDDLKLAATATQGYPFLIQLVGYFLWLSIKGESIGKLQVAKAIDKARAELEELVLESSYNDLSNGDRIFATEIAKVGDAVKVKDLITATGKSKQYVNQYLERLTDAGYIVRTERGTVAFAMPFMRSYILSKQNRG
ncbi:MAG: hypothetical protein LBC58_00410 [Clostridiales Family XIII bacterium]|jgi:DNA-binding transcriptional ArsR family regulator|nr:hypothetical protein [Clostridiales Family XIII bacterium]